MLWATTPDRRSSIATCSKCPPSLGGSEIGSNRCSPEVPAIRGGGLPMYAFWAIFASPIAYTFQGREQEMQAGLIRLIPVVAILVAVAPVIAAEAADPPQGRQADT